MYQVRILFITYLLNCCKYLTCLSSSIDVINAGGPFGAEAIISEAGPLIGIIGIIIFPFLWVGAHS
jgi:hypothetical protein